MTPCNACRWRTAAGTCELQLIAGPVGESVLWCAHVTQCPHVAVQGHVERLLRIDTRIGRLACISDIERDFGPILAGSVRDAFSVAFAKTRQSALDGRRFNEHKDGGAWVAK